jgi:uncharacterized protein (DUF2236 family)
MAMTSEALKREAAGERPKPRKGIRNPTEVIDFLNPKGDPGLLGPGSMGWRVSTNPIAGAVGGVAAVILELSEPAIRAGVWDHSTFKVDPIRRMENTGLAAAAVTYGPTKAAEQMFQRVTRMHERVSGTTHEGVPYTAMDPDLLTWVHVTAAWGFLNAYIRYVNPALSHADQDRYYSEGQVMGKGFGATWVPTSVAEVESYMRDMAPKLYANDTVQEFLTLVGNATPLGAIGKPVQRLLAQAAIDLLPDWLQKQTGVRVSPFIKPVLRPTVRALARFATFAERYGPETPGQQACRRMGVSTDCLR